MKTCQSTGYTQQAYKILLLCLVSTVVSAGSAMALTGNNIDQCYDCHGSAGDIRPVDTPAASLVSYRNITTGAVKGSHRTHTTNMPATLSSAVCTPCHGTAPTTMDHRNGQIIMNVAVAYTKSPFFNQTSVPILGTCATASCHASPYGTGSVVTPSWGVVSGCAACHNSTSGAAAAFDATLGAPTTGGHTRHMSAPNNIACNTCHSNVAKDTNTSSVHINGFINVSGYNPKQVAKHSIGTGYASCTTTLCHGSSSPSWSVSTTNDTCTKCHGTGTTTVTTANRYVVAPPNSVSGVPGTLTGTGQVSNNKKVGAHQTHLQFFNGYSNYSTVDFRCQGCHGALPASGSHANGSSSPNTFWSNLATRGGKAPSFNSVNLTCSNTYCHNPAGAGSTINAANTGNSVFPSWTGANYMANGTRVTAPANCSKCHKVPGDAGFTSSFSHGATTIANTCSGCHGHEGDNTGAVGKRHMDGIIWGAGACNTCHDYDTTGGVWNVKAINYGGFGQGNGAHAKHIDFLKTRYSVTLNPATDTFGAGGPMEKVCGVCHTINPTNHTMSDSAQPRSINFGDGSLVHQYGTLAPVYNGAYNVNNTTQAKTCSNIDCHYKVSPAWP